MTTAGRFYLIECDWLIGIGRQTSNIKLREMPREFAKLPQRIAQGALASFLLREINELHFPRSLSQIQQRQGHRQLKSLGARAARIQIENSVTLPLFGLVSMTTNDGVEAGSFWPHVQCA